MRLKLVVFVLLAGLVNNIYASDIINDIRQVSVTLVSQDQMFGSGVLITRKDKNFVLTAAHIFKDSRHEITVEKTDKTRVKEIEFDPVFVIKDVDTETGKNNEIVVTGKVIKYSDAELGEDLALVQLDEKKFDLDTKFYSKKEVPKVGTKLFHVGSILGYEGSNSLTDGLISKIGCKTRLTFPNEVIFDRTTITAFPGSSGGGVFDKDTGEYLGMLVRIIQPNYNLIVPVRRIKDWTVKNKIEWVLDKSKPLPKDEELAKIPVE
jgi:S1-C subfamily serine protease